MAATPGPVDRVDLHIGVEKTGTSTIQAALHRERDRLLEAGVLYPTSLGRGNHMALAIIGRDDDAIDDLRRLRGLLTPIDVQAFREEKAEALRREVVEAGVGRVLLSNEHCSSRLRQPAEVERLVAWLQEVVGGDLHVHVYLRRQDRMVESRHSTAVRFGVAERLQAPDERQFALLYDFEALLERWAAVVGEDHLHPRRFERSRLLDGDVVADLTAALDLPRVTSAASGLVNTALDAPTERFTALLNRHIPRFTDEGHDELHARMLRALDAVEPIGGPERLPPAEAADLLRRAAPGNDAVAERWFDGPPLFEEGPDDTEPVHELDVERAVELAGHVLRHVTDELTAEHDRETEALRRRVERLQAQADAARSKVAAARARADRLQNMPSHRLGRALAHPIRTLRRRLEG